MRLNLFTFALLSLAALMAYVRLPELTSDLRRDWQPYMFSMLLSSALVGVGAFVGFICVAVLVAEWMTRRRG